MVPECLINNGYWSIGAVYTDRETIISLQRGKRSIESKIALFEEKPRLARIKEVATRVGMGIGSLASTVAGIAIGRAIVPLLPDLLQTFTFGLGTMILGGIGGILPGIVIASMSVGAVAIPIILFGAGCMGLNHARKRQMPTIDTLRTELGKLPADAKLTADLNKLNGIIACYNNQ